MEPKIIVIEFVDDLLDDAEEVIGRLVTDKDGVEHKVKKGKQGSRLWERWEELDNGKGRAVKLIMDGFNAKDGNTYPFVADFKWVEGELPAAIEPARAGTPDASGTPKATPIDARSKEIRSMVCYKEIGELIRADKMVEVFGKDIAKLTTQYYNDFIQKNL